MIQLTHAQLRCRYLFVKKNTGWSFEKVMNAFDIKIIEPEIDAANMADYEAQVIKELQL